MKKTRWMEYEALDFSRRQCIREEKYHGEIYYRSGDYYNWMSVTDDATMSWFIKLNPVNQPRSQQSSAGNVIRSEYLWIHTHRVIQSPSVQPMYRCFSWYEFDVSTPWIVPAIYPVIIRCIALSCYTPSTLSPTIRHLFHPTGSLLLPSAKINIRVSTHLYKISLSIEYHLALK